MIKKPDFLLAAPCLFGLEGLLAAELRALDARDVRAENGRVFFCGGPETVARANIGSRYAERILIVLGRFPAPTFDALFEGTKALPWEEFIGRDDAFPVKGWALKSALHSVPDCQSIVKKAVVERLKARYRVPWFAETGGTRQIQFAIWQDEAALMLDTSGAGLHKRGYRPLTTTAPIKETLAAALAYLTHLYPDSTLYDPFCGSGTLLIEGALLVRRVAPGLKRAFAAERFPALPPGIWQRERERAQGEIRPAPDFAAIGADSDPGCVEATMENARRAGIAEHVRVSAADIGEFAPAGERGVVLTNPPYGERLLDVNAARALYRRMGQVFPEKPGWRYNVVSADAEFEQYFGRAADKRRKVYNGMIQCQFFQFGVKR